jgi:hypothetical protein
LFEFSAKNVSFFKDPIVSGIGPEKPQLTNAKESRFFKFPISRGIVPVMPVLYERSLYEQKHVISLATTEYYNHNCGRRDTENLDVAFQNIVADIN